MPDKDIFKTTTFKFDILSEIETQSIAEQRFALLYRKFQSNTLEDCDSGLHKTKKCDALDSDLYHNNGSRITGN